MPDEAGDVVTLWRPVGPVELELIRKSGMRAFPPRLPEQPIFYPVLSEEYAVKIARDWNVPASGSVRRSFLENYSVQKAGGFAHLEYWIPAEEMTAFNETIVGEIKIVAEFRRRALSPLPRPALAGSRRAKLVLS